MKKVASIHFVGIKGVGMTPLAVIAKEAGIEVTGSDIGDTFITDATLKKAGISPLVGFSPDHIQNPDVVITTGAHGGYYNPEVVAAKTKNIPIFTKGEAVGEYMKGDILGRTFAGISVAGSHGKTTTSAMIATVLKEAGRDPSYIIGTSEIASLGLSGHLGKGEYFVAEADEYATEPKMDHTAQFLWQKPKYAVFTNIELDHPDIYPSVTAVREVFLKLAKKLAEEGALIANGDDQQVRLLLAEYKGRAITYGESKLNDFVISNIRTSGPQTFFWLTQKGESLGEFGLRVVGAHNAFNATAVVILGLEIGMSLDEIKKGLKAFSGTKRRLEYKGVLPSGTVVFDDYAHHPTEISSTLKAMKQMYPERKLQVFFQPHTYSRTKTLLPEFAKAFKDASVISLLPIYASLRESADPTISSEILAEEIKKEHKTVHVLQGTSDVIKYIESSNFSDETVLVFMGAGDIYKIIDELPLDKKDSSYG